MSIASSTLSQLGHFFTGDTLFFAVTFVLFVFVAIYVDRTRVISFILAFYPAMVLFNSVPFMEKLLIMQDNILVLNKIAIFLAFIVPISMIINSYIVSDSFYSGVSRLFRSAGYALIALVLVVMFSYEVVNYDVFHNFSPYIDSLFNPATRIFYWNVGIFALLAIL